MPGQTITSPKRTDATKSWEGWNHEGNSASFRTLTVAMIRAHNCLPRGVLAATALFPRRNYAPPGEYATVQWTVAKVVGTSVDDGQGRTTAGIAIEGGLTQFEDGGTGGRNCSEHELWEDAAGHFDRKQATYVARVNLAPCLRCCRSLIAIATDRNSPVVVLADMDYEILDAARTEITDRSYAFAFIPGRPDFIVIHNNQVPRAFANNLGPWVEERLACIACQTPASDPNAAANENSPCRSGQCNGAAKMMVATPFKEGRPMW